MFNKFILVAFFGCFFICCLAIAEKQEEQKNESFDNSNVNTTSVMYKAKKMLEIAKRVYNLDSKKVELELGRLKKKLNKDLISVWMKFKGKKKYEEERDQLIKFYEAQRANWRAYLEKLDQHLTEVVWKFFNPTD